jgi:hypothetical protein
MFVTCSKVMENSEAEKAEILADVAYLLKVEAMIGDRFQTRSFRKHSILFFTEKPDTIPLHTADREHSGHLRAQSEKQCTLYWRYNADL